MKTLIFLLFIGINTGFKEESCIKADLIILADQSGSVYMDNGYVYKAISSFVSRFELEEEGLKMAFITFNSDISIKYHLGANRDSLMKAVHSINYTIPTGNTRLFEALLASINEFNVYGRTDINRIVVIISDGAPDDTYSAIEAAKQLKLMYNCKIYGILVKSTLTNEPFMQQLSSKGCYLETNYTSLIENLEKLDICL